VGAARFRLGAIVALALISLFVGSIPIGATTAAQSLPYEQHWTDTTQIGANDDWSGVPGVVGYLGDDASTTANDIDPRTRTSAAFSATVDVIANQTSTAITNGGVAEFQLTDPTIALQGSGAADAPNIVVSLNTTGLGNIHVSYNLRDIDGGADDAAQQVALHYRVGDTGDFTNVAAGYVADATTGGAASQVTPVSVTLPADANGKPLVQFRVMTSNATGSDEWVGVDDIVVTGTPIAAEEPPSVLSTSPANGAGSVPVDSNITVVFSEPVNVSAGWYGIFCGVSGIHTATDSGDGTTFTINPGTNFAPSETCALTITATQVSDQDADDPPDTMIANKTISFTTAAAVAKLVINEVDYDQPSTDTAEFLELKNIGNSAVDLDPYSVELVNAATTPPSIYRTIDLPAVSLAAGDYYVICANAATVVNCDLDSAPDTDFIQNGAPDAIGLRNGSALVDAVSYEGNTTGYTEGSGVGVLDSGVGAAGISRCPDGSDTDQNSVDFKTAGITPGAANGCAADDAPAVTTRIPSNGATGVTADSNVTIGFSEPVNVTGSWFTISCTSSGSHTASVAGGPTSFTLDPDTDFTSGESCTVTVLAANVTDQDAIDPPDNMAANDTFSFDVATSFACGDSATPIDVIQGSGAGSDRVGQVATIEGAVVGDYQLSSEFSGFYVQEDAADADADPATSEGIFVFGGGVDVNRGDRVRVRGTVAEFNGLTELSSVSAVAVCSTGVTVPATQVSLPVAAVNDLERYEGMLVNFNQTLTVTEVFNLGRFGEVSLSGAGRLYTPTAVAAPGAPAQAVAAQNDRSRIILDDGNGQQNIDPTRYPQGGLSASNTLRVGDALNALTGIMDFRFAAYRIQPVGPLSFDHTNPRTAAPAPVGGNLKVASFNVLNYFNGDGAGGGFPTSRGANTPQEFARQRAKEVSALKAMNADIVGLMEMENDAPPNSAVEDLVAGLNDAMGAGTYSFINTGVIGTDEIKVALIFKPSTVTPVGAYKLMTSAVDPRFVDTLNRPSLAQTFQQKATGGKLTVVVNHLKSKGSECAGDPDTGDEQGNCNQTRTRAAAALVDWLKTDPTGSGDPDFLLIGDMNSYTFEDPITTFVGGGLRNLVRERDGLTAYSYVFDGESGYLDHALATPSLAAQVTGVDHWHINPDEPTVLDYNTEFKTANQVNTFYDSGPYRSSDHDPVVIGLAFNSPPTASAGGPYSIDEGGSVSVSASGSDADGDPLTYAWDLDNDGTFETSGQTATFSAAAIDGPATRTIRVQVSDGKEATIATATVTINNVPPTATFNAPTSVFAGFAFTLSFSGASDPSAADTTAGFTYAFDCGDGTGYTSFAAAASTTCSTSDTGTRNVKGKIRDKDGGVSEYSASVQVIVTFDSLCSLARHVVTSSDVASALCDKLAAASQSANPARENQLEAFRNQVDAQTGKSIAPADAAVLKRLSTRL
jgi:uncharacterized protein